MNSSEFMDIYEAALTGDPMAKQTVQLFTEHVQTHSAIYQKALQATMPVQSQSQGQARQDGKPQQAPTPNKSEAQA